MVPSPQPGAMREEPRKGAPRDLHPAALTRLSPLPAVPPDNHESHLGTNSSAANRAEARYHCRPLSHSHNARSLLPSEAHPYPRAREGQRAPRF